MLRYNKSPINSYKIITFFKGQNLSKGDFYKYEESFSLFGKENLASNLIEFDEGDVLDLKTNNEICNIISEVDKISKNNFFNIVLVRLVNNLKTDAEVSCDSERFSEFDMCTFKNSISGLGKFSLTMKEKEEEGDEYIRGLDKRRMRYIRLDISRKFFENGKSRLSEYLIKDSFSPEKYVDTSLLMFLFMVALPGNTEDFTEEDKIKIEEAFKK